MVRRRGLPGSARHRALREQQVAHAGLPSHHVLAQLVLHRLRMAALFVEHTADDIYSPAFVGLLDTLTLLEASGVVIPSCGHLAPVVRQPNARGSSWASAPG
ncbi:hypothetical protein ACFYNY_24480 [Streptomyces sp. NPDC006530]|uniref:hypothetical protein n=1 Tax=Streptomyces sp. NPDC006530 TaxID=3364750 RepID=UPI0036C9352F